MKRTLLMTGAAAFALSACASMPFIGAESSGVSSAAAVEIPAELQSPRFGAWGIDTGQMLADVDPGDDFYRYVNGHWLDTFELPADRSNYGSFTLLAELSEARTRDIIEGAAEADAAEGSVERKIGDLFASFMDEEAVEAAGLAPIQDELGYFAGLETHDDVARAMMRADLAGNAPWGGWVDIDSGNTSRYIFYITQAGLGLPDRDYYFSDDERLAGVRAAYVDFAELILGEIGHEDPAAAAQSIMDLETRMAEVHWERARRRDRDLTYNPMTIDELEAQAPGFPWRMALAAGGLGGENEFIVREQDAVLALADIFADTPVQTWRDYLAFHFTHTHAPFLPAAIDDANFDFYGRTLSGTPEQRERWKRGVSTVNGNLGEAVGQVYVDRYFSAESRDAMQDLVGNLRTAFAGRLETLEWMTDPTRAEAFTKLEMFNTKIGYPEEWQDYSALEIRRDDLLGNIQRSNQFAWDDMISDLGGPIDRAEWFMNPQTVNAYYSPNRNEIVFPAAILQAPFFDLEADPAVNYGAIGAVIGHEIGHGFDDQGRKSDGTGMLREWWTADDEAAFEGRAAMLGSQYDGYSPVAGMNVNGELTMGENIGDLGGLSMAYHAYQLSLNGEPAPVIDGFTGDQRFFMGWAQVWRRLYREEELIRRLSTDPHSPSEYRTNGVVRNMDAWYAAFNVTEDDALYLPPEQRVRIW